MKMNALVGHPCKIDRASLLFLVCEFIGLDPGLTCMMWSCAIQLLYFAVYDTMKDGGSSELRAALSSHAIWNLRYDREFFPILPLVVGLARRGNKPPHYTQVR